MLPFITGNICIGLLLLVGSASQGEIGGVVQDADGQPVRRAIVIAVNSATGFVQWTGPDQVTGSYGSDLVWADGPGWSTSDARTGAAMAKTDREGRFHFTGLREGSFVLLAVHPEKGMLIVRDAKPGPEAEALTLKLPPATFVEGKIHGYKKGKTGMWHGAEEMVRVNRVNDHAFSGLAPKRSNGHYVLSIQPSTKIDNDGSFRVGPLPCGGRMRLLIQRWDGKLFQETVILHVTLDVPEGKTTRFEYDFTSNHTVSGTLRDEEGKPIPDAAVQLDFTIKEDDGLGVSTLGSVTDSKGRYAVRGVPPGTHKLSAHRMAGLSTAAQLGTACEDVQMEFKAEQVVIVNEGDAPEIDIKLTRADRQRARTINAKREGAAEDAEETIPPDKWFEPTATAR